MKSKLVIIHVDACCQILVNLYEVDILKEIFGFLVLVTVLLKYMHTGKHKDRADQQENVVYNEESFERGCCAIWQHIRPHYVAFTPHTN